MDNASEAPEIFVLKADLLVCSLLGHLLTFSGFGQFFNVKVGSSLELLHELDALVELRLCVFNSLALQKRSPDEVIDLIWFVVVIELRRLHFIDQHLKSLSVDIPLQLGLGKSALSNISNDLVHLGPLCKYSYVA